MGGAGGDQSTPQPDDPEPAQPPLGPTCEGHFDPHQQSDLDALAGCVEIIGTLIVETFEGADLEPLANLEVVSDALIIGSNAMAGFESLEGLRSLRSVGWFLDLNNTLAPDLSGLRSLTTVGGSDEEGAGGVHITNNHKLVNLSGLDSLTTFASLKLGYNGSLTSLAGLELPETLGYITLVGEESLISTEALSAVRQLGALSVRVSNSLQELTGLDNLVELQYLRVDQNAALTSIASMPQVTELQGIWLEQNPKLVEVASFPSLTRSESLSVVLNDTLSVLHFPALAEVGDLLLANNPELPPSAVEAIAALVQGTAKVGRNQGEPDALSPCPWEGDEICDEAVELGYLCAEGTDVDCVCNFECGP